jgi:hypothetical protein
MNAWVEMDRQPNPFGFIPVTHLRNRPKLDTPTKGRSELSGLENDLARINKFSADLMLLSEFSSFKVRYATGLAVNTDEAGNPIQPFSIGPDRLLLAEAPDAKFGTLDETSLDPMLNALKASMSQVAALSRTPLWYLSGDLVNLSGDSLRVMDSQHVTKVKQRQLELQEAFEQTMRMILRVEGSPLADGPVEVMWQDPTQRSFSELANGITQLSSVNVLPREQAWVELGYGPVERERMRAYAVQDAATARVASLADQTATRLRAVAAS